jgi:hypothetical protein
MFVTEEHLPPRRRVTLLMRVGFGFHCWLAQQCFLRHNGSVPDLRIVAKDRAFPEADGHCWASRQWHPVYRSGASMENLRKKKMILPRHGCHPYYSC